MTHNKLGVRVKGRALRGVAIWDSASGSLFNEIRWLLSGWFGLEAF